MLELETATPQATAVPTAVVADKTPAAAAKKAEVGCHGFGENLSVICTNEISIILGPKWHAPNGSMTFHRAQKGLDFQGPTPSHLP
jgi:hypothetical protein